MRFSLNNVAGVICTGASVIAAAVALDSRNPAQETSKNSVKLGSRTMQVVLRKTDLGFYREMSFYDGAKKVAELTPSGIDIRYGNYTIGASASLSLKKWDEGNYQVTETRRVPRVFSSNDVASASQ